MLAISQAQLDAIGRARRRVARARLLGRLRARHPAACTPLSDSDLRELVRKGTAAAHGYGIREAKDLERYYDAMLTLGPDFDRDPAHPYPGQVLNMKALNGPAKVDMVMAYLKELPGDAGQE